METLIKESLINNLEVKIFGVIISELDFKFSNEKNNALSNFSNPVIVKVEGAKFQGFCIKFREPKILVLPNKGLAPDDCGYDSNDKSIKMWVLEKSFESTEIEIKHFNIETLLQEKAVVEIKLKSVQYTGGILSGKAQITINLGIKFSDEIRFSAQIAPGGWFDIWSGDLAGYGISVQANISTTSACLRLVTPLGTSSKHCKDF